MTTRALYVLLSLPTRIIIYIGTCIFPIFNYCTFSSWMCSKYVEFFHSRVFPKCKLFSWSFLLLYKALPNFLWVSPCGYSFLQHQLFVGPSRLLQIHVGWSFCYTWLLFFFIMPHLLWRLPLLFPQWDQARLWGYLHSDLDLNFQLWGSFYSDYRISPIYHLEWSFPYGRVRSCSICSQYMWQLFYPSSISLFYSFP